MVTIYRLPDTPAFLPVIKLSQYSIDPSEEPYEAVKYIFIYIFAASKGRIYRAFGDPVMASSWASYSCTTVFPYEGLMISTLSTGDQIPLIVTQISVSPVVTGSSVLLVYQYENERCHSQ